MADLADLKRAHGFTGDRDSLKECIEAGKKAMDAQAFANGYGLASGARVRSVVPVPVR